jgi:Ankyrin repeats (3 copies)
MLGAAQFNKLAEVQYLHEQGCPWPMKVLEQAAREGHFELVRWCYEHGCTWHEILKVPFIAAQSGNIELMAWVLQLPGIRLSGSAMYGAARYGHIAMCQFLHSQQCPWGKCSPQVAAQHGHVDLLRWLLDNGCPCNASSVSESAARGGSVEVCMYIQQQGLLTSAALLTDMLNTAGSCNKLAVAKWLRHQGAQWPTAFRHGFWSGELLAWA